LSIAAHPDAITEASAINAEGGLDYLDAIGELSSILNHIYDGTRSVDDLLYEHSPSGTVRMFTRQFWGERGASIVAAVCVWSNRSQLMSIVAVDLPLPKAGYSTALTYSQAVDKALDLAHQRI